MSLTGASGPSGQLRSTVARGSIIGVVGAVTTTVGGFALVVAATRGLGATESGRLFVAIAVFTVLTNVTKLGADTALVRFVARSVSDGHHSDVRSLLRVGIPPPLLASGLLAALLFLTAPTVGGWLYRDLSRLAAADYMHTLAWSIPAGTLTLVLLAVTRGFGSLGTFVAVEQVLKPLSRPLLVMAVAVAGGTGLAAFRSWLAPVSFGLVLAALSVVRLLRADARSEGARAAAPSDAEPRIPVSARSFWHFAAPRALAGPLEIIAPWVAVLLLSALSGSEPAAHFTAVTRIAVAGTVVMVAMRLALAPYLSAALGRHDVAAAERLHRHSTTFSILLAWPFFLLVMVFPATVLDVFGAGFSDAQLALVLVAAANLLNVAVGNVQTLILMGGRSAWNLIDTAAAVLVQLVLAAVLIPPFGVTGAGVGLAAGIAVNNILATVQVHNGLRLPVWSQQCTAAVLASLVSVACCGLGMRLLLGDSLVAAFTASVLTGGLLVLVARWRPELFALREGLAVLRGRGTPAHDEGA